MKFFMTAALAITVTILLGCNDSDEKDVKESTQIKEPTLVSFARLDVKTYADGPESGKYVKGANGIFPMFPGQPVQGFSAALKNKDGTYLVMSDISIGVVFQKVC